jgi:hypothetical protein
MQYKGMHLCPKCDRVERTVVTLLGDDVSVRCLHCGLSFGHRTTIDGVRMVGFDDRARQQVDTPTDAPDIDRQIRVINFTHPTKMSRQRDRTH